MFETDRTSVNRHISNIYKTEELEEKSTCAKIAQVQAAIAAEPKAPHVPRVRPPAVVVDDGPLVLVETRKDLSDMKLPF